MFMMEQEQRAELERLFDSDRYKNIVRPYSVDQVLKFRPVVPRSYAAGHQAVKLWKLLKENVKNKKASFTFGALDPVQVRTFTMDGKC